MQKILAIARTDLRIFLSQRGNLIGIFLLPVVLTLILGYSFGSSGSGPSRLRVDVLDEDASARSAQFLDALRAANPDFVLCPFDNDADDFCALDGEPLDRALGLDRVTANLTAGFLIIPADYAAGISEGQARQIDYYSHDDPSFPGPVAQAVQSVLSEVNSAAVAARVGGSLLNNLTNLLALPLTAAADPLTQTIYTAANARLQARPAPVRFATTDGDSDSTISGIQAGFGQSVPGMGSMYVMFTVLGGAAVLLRERRQWTLQRLAIMPITRAQLLGGKILAYFTLGMIQYLVIFLVGWGVGLDLGDDPLGLLAIMVAFVLCMTALAFVLAIYMQNEEQAAGTARLLALTLAPLGGAWWPLQITPDFMQAIGKLSPIAWAMQGFQDLLFYGGSLVSVLPEVGILLAAAVVLFGVAVSQFRVE